MKVNLAIVLAILVASAEAVPYELLDPFHPSLDNSLPNQNSVEVLLSRDTQWAYVETWADNLVFPRGPVDQTVVLIDRTTHQQRYASKNLTGTPVQSSLIDISDDGRLALLYCEDARNFGFPLLGCCSRNGIYYLYDRDTDSTRLITQHAGVSYPIRMYWDPDLSPCGTKIAFRPMIHTGHPLYWGNGGLVLLDLNTNSVTETPYALDLSERSLAVSNAGATVAFASVQQDIVAGTQNTYSQIYLWSPTLGTFSRLSENQGQPGNGDSRFLWSSSDGRYVFFNTGSSNLAPGDTNAYANYVRCDTLSGSIRVCELTGTGTMMTAQPRGFATDHDGQWVSFTTMSAGALPGLGANHTILRNMDTGEYEVVNRTYDGGILGSEALDARPHQVLSGGDAVTVTTSNPNWVVGDNSIRDAFLRNRLQGVSERLLTGQPAPTGNWGSSFPSSSADGRYIAFQSDSRSLVPGDLNDKVDIFVRDRTAQSTSLISSSSTGVQGNYDSYQPSISADGNLIAFSTLSTTFASGVLATAGQLYLKNRTTGQIKLVSRNSFGTAGNGNSYLDFVSPSGDAVYFSTYATNLGANALGSQNGIMRYDSATNTCAPFNVSAPGQLPSNNGDARGMSGDGRYLCFISSSTRIDPSNGSSTQIYVRDLVTGENRLASVKPDGQRVDGYCSSVAMSRNGKRVIFFTLGWNEYDHPHDEYRVFMKDLETGELRLISRDYYGNPMSLQDYYLAINHDGSRAAFGTGWKQLWPFHNGRGRSAMLYDWEHDRIFPPLAEVPDIGGSVGAPLFVGNSNEVVYSVGDTTLIDGIRRSGGHLVVGTAEPYFGLAGVISFGDWTGSIPDSVAIEIYADSGELLDTVPVQVETGGQFTSEYMGRNMQPAYIYLRHSPWLGKRVGPYNLQTPNLNVEFDLTNGDCDGDNEVGPGDFGFISAAFGSEPGDQNWNPAADLDGNLSVDIGDFGILSANFGLSGDSVIP